MATRYLGVTRDLSSFAATTSIIYTIVRAREDGSADQIAFKAWSNTGSNITMNACIYAVDLNLWAATPTTPIVQGTSITVGTTEAWQYVTIASTAITKDTYYAIAVWGSGSYNIRYEGTQDFRYGSYEDASPGTSFPTFPNPDPGTGSAIGNWGQSYIRYTPTTPAITFYDYTALPGDDAAATNTATQNTITPPPAMETGDLCVVVMVQRGTATMSVGVTGGQTWNSFTRFTGTNLAVQIYWCVFNGTWSASPRFDFSAGTCTSVVMSVAKSLDTSYQWAIDQTQTTGSFVAGSTPFTKTITGITNSNSATITFAVWVTADDNTWGSISGSGWSQQGLQKDSGNIQFRNTSGSDQSLTIAYKIGGSGATGNVSLNQATLGGDAGITSIFSFYTYPSNTLFKTFNGNLNGNTKTVNGLAIASVKTVLGV